MNDDEILYWKELIFFGKRYEYEIYDSLYWSKQNRNATFRLEVIIEEINRIIREKNKYICK